MLCGKEVRIHLLTIQKFYNMDKPKDEGDRDTQTQVYEKYRFYTFHG